MQLHNSEEQSGQYELETFVDDKEFCKFFLLEIGNF